MLPSIFTTNVHHRVMLLSADSAQHSRLNSGAFFHFDFVVLWSFTQHEPFDMLVSIVDNAEQYESIDFESYHSVAGISDRPIN